MPDRLDAGAPTRRALLALCGLPLLAYADANANANAKANANDAAALLRRGGVVLMLRHAQTTPGIGDPPGFRLGDCSSQRQLSDEGRAQARQLGEWFTQQKLTPGRVRSSAWCRCVDTAMLAFGRSEPWPVIDSTFGDAATGTAAGTSHAPAIDAALRAVPAGRFEVWITHQVNITAATGAFLGMGEGVVVKAGATASTRPLIVARLVV